MNASFKKLFAMAAILVTILGGLFYATPVSANGDIPVVTPPPAEQVPYACSRDGFNVNVRSSASTRAPAIGILHNGECLQVTGRDDAAGWLLVTGAQSKDGKSFVDGFVSAEVVHTEYDFVYGGSVSSDPGVPYADIVSPTPEVTETPQPNGASYVQPDQNTTNVVFQQQPQPNGTPEATIDPTTCGQPPTDLETLPRYIVDMAPFGQFFHPVYDMDRFQQSTGSEGQWSWFHTMCLINGQGGQFRNFEKNDGRFVFRVNTTSSFVSFAVLTTNTYRTQFMNGADEFKSAMNIRTLPGTTIEIFDPMTGQTLGSQAVSRGGDLLVVLPDNGLVGVSFVINDPSATFEAQVWFGPDDRPNANINRFDASALIPVATPQA